MLYVIVRDLLANALTPVVDCGATIATTASQINDTTDCTMPCAGNVSEPCGGISRLSLFWSGVSPPSTNPGPAPWSFVGCYTLVSSDNFYLGTDVAIVKA